MRMSRCLYRLDARVKLAGLLLILITCVSTPPENFAAFAGYAALAAVVCAASGLTFRDLKAPLFIVLPIIASAAVFIPLLRPGEVGGGYNLGFGDAHAARSGWLIFWNIAVKALLGVVFTRAVITATPFPDLVRAMNQLGCPRLLVLLVTFTYRYAALLSEEAARMRRAALARGYRGRWLWHGSTVGRLVGALFLRSYERGERVYLAMLARGFQGEFPAQARRLRFADYGFIAATVCTLVILRWGVA